ncbi:predicted protein [Brucella sp. NVSL 07-0026]|nr:predicted protein [Brucella sp. NVSL 07-0026]
MIVRSSGTSFMALLVRLLHIALFSSLALPVLSGYAQADEAAGTVASHPVQLYDPGDEIYHDRRIRVYIDAYGRRVTMDRRGRILSVEAANSYDRNQYAARGRAVAPDDN